MGLEYTVESVGTKLDYDPAEGNGSVKDNFQAYINDIRQHPLLSMEEEAQLARTYRKKTVKVSIREAARQRLITSNLRLVICVARPYYRSVPLEEKVSAGNLGLIHAVELFDPDKGKFSTYASYWIRQAIRRECIEHSSFIYIPAYLFDFRRILKKCRDDYYKEHGEHPTNESLEQELGENSAEWMARLQSFVPVYSINAFEGTNALECIRGRGVADTSRKFISPVDDAIYQEMQENLEETISGLPEREWFIFEQCILGGMPLKQMGRVLNISRERVRQLREGIFDCLFRQLSNKYPIVLKSNTLNLLIP